VFLLFQTFLETITNKLKSHKHFTCRKLETSDKSMEFHRDFKICHYAGDVIYNVNGFIDKNKDTLFQDFKRLLYNSSDQLISSWWPEGKKDMTAVTKRPLTAGTNFKVSITELVDNLLRKEPYYVRCIKPNELKSPTAFNYERVKHQVSYLGLLENIRVRRAGFAYRMDYTRFLRRYKMISKYTWPNFRGGSDKDGCKKILDEQGFSNDVQYGKTKIFIRSPQTIFTLEESRNQKIPGIVVFLQKCWRGGIARLRYKRTKAIYKIMAFYKRYKMRSYIAKLAGVFRNAKRSPDYGKSLKWPAPPHLLLGHIDMLKKVYARWRAYMILQRIPRDEWASMHLKILAADAFKRQRRNFGLDRKWEGNYIAMANEVPNKTDAESALNNLKRADQFSKIYFTSLCKKTNKYSKTAERAICITNTHFYKLDPKKKFKPMKKGIPVSELRGVSVSPGTDQLIIIHLAGGNDFVLCLQGRNNGEDRVGEAVGALCKLYNDLHHKDSLKVEVKTTMSCRLGDKLRNVSVENGNAGPTFKKNGEALVLVYPNGHTA